MTQADREPLLQKVIDECEQLGLRWCHFPDSRRIQGWGGFVDLVVVGRGGALFREVKEASRPNRSQLAWIRALDDAGVDAALWRWPDWPDKIRAELHAIAGR